jgi:import inner membrane translocase subunit TIM54
MIFLTITGSFTGALFYDRRQKKRAQQKWADLVAHISKETLPVEQTRRKLTVFLSAPPGDGLREARGYFKEYVKPVLVAAALDYEVIEGRKEGDVRAGLAEKIRSFRRKAGERSTAVEEQDADVIEETRRKMGIHEEPGPRGDVVIGRHTWKEYIRGLHEGWLGPLDPPPPPVLEPTPDAKAQQTTASTDGSAAQSSDNAPSTSENKDSADSKEEKKSEEASKPTGPTPAYISPAEYTSRSLPVTIPPTFEASSPIPFPHILGFLNTPIRIYRFLTQRYLADSVGREVAAVVLASSMRPYQDGSYSSDSELSATDGFSSEPISSGASSSLSARAYEQQTVLEHEEQEWHKSVRKAAAARKSEEDKDKKNEDESNKDPEPEQRQEREWLDDVVLDPRIASRMRRYILAPEEEARAERIAEGTEWILGEAERRKQVPLWKRLWVEYGYGEDEEQAKRKPIIGNLDNEDE